MVSQDPKENRLDMGDMTDVIDSNICCTWFGSYDDDTGTGREWLQCEVDTWRLSVTLMLQGIWRYVLYASVFVLVLSWKCTQKRHWANTWGKTSCSRNSYYQLFVIDSTQEKHDNYPPALKPLKLDASPRPLKLDASPRPRARRQPSTSQAGCQPST